MPATAGRVRMPANNRVHSSAALQTHGIWQVAIGYDPYAPANKGKESKPDSAAVENAYDSFQGLLSLARLTNANSNETRGACKKCGRVGHLTYQCRNFLSLKDGKPLEDDDSAVHKAHAVFEKIKKAAGGGEEEASEGEEDDDDEISGSDSDVDPEIERIIAERLGKPLSKKVEALSKGSKKSVNLSSDEEEEEDRRKKRKHGDKKKRRSRGRSRHRHCTSDSSDDGLDSDRHRKHKRRRRRRRRSESSDSDSGSGFERHGKRLRHKERKSVLSSDSESTASSSDEDESSKRREKRRSKGHRSRGKDCLD